MWKTFINGLAAILLMQACAVTDREDLWERSPDREAGLWERSPDREPGLWERSPDREPVPAASPAKPPPPAPEVRGRNGELFARATELLLDGRLTEAETLLLEVTSDQPELAGPWINLAQVYLADAREDEALAALEQAVLANPANCAARTDLGVLLRRRGELAAAESHYLACLEYQPGYQAVYLNLGILYDLYLGRLSEALAAYRRYQSLADQPDKRVDGWVVDLERRIGS